MAMAENDKRFLLFLQRRLKWYLITNWIQKLYLITEMDTEVILDHIEMDTEVIKLIHVVKELLYSQDDHEIMIIWIWDHKGIGLDTRARVPKIELLYGEIHTPGCLVSLPSSCRLLDKLGEVGSILFVSSSDDTIAAARAIAVAMAGILYVSRRWD